MARYLVGESGFFKQKWGFVQAVEAAGDGDIVELEEGFCPFNEQKNKSITVTRSITIEGHPNSNGALTNIIDGVIVKNGATVTLKNLEVRKNADKCNNINVCDGAVLIAESVILSSYATVGENYPIVYIKNGSKVSLVNSLVAPGYLHDRKYRIYAEDATLEIANSTINARVQVSGSRLDIQNSLIQYSEANALYAEKNSVVTILASTLEGGGRVEKSSWSCARLVDSELKATDTFVKQPGEKSALYATNAKITLNSDRYDSAYDSLYVEKSEVSIGIIYVMESFCICNGSHVTAEAIGIVGRENGTVNLYLNQKSLLEADTLCFGKLTQPNIKAERNTTIKAEEMIQIAYDPETWRFISNGQGLEKAGDASKIEYFGELTAFEKLNQMVGITGVKQTAEEFVAIAEMNKKREKQGYKNAAFSLHSMFLGNPGTGKTTVARLLGKILYEKGIISSEEFIETSRSDLVGRYIGETAIKTREVLESAMGGVLFIDEAYSLWAGKDNSQDFGIEAINEILKFMEDHRQDIVLIFAGYTSEMERFLESNEGLRSRIPNIFLFEDYTEEELVRIGMKELHSQKYEIDGKAYADLIYKKFSESNDNSNGRWVRNLNEKLIRKMAVRASRDPNANLVLITQEDIDAI
ncbi:MAG: AAA family ATPase [Ruminococcus flavefaciens]|nr:AAA family ATPase [Ruminococcus flavefaciens]